MDDLEEEIERQKLPEPIIEIVRMTQPNLEKKCEITGEDCWVLISREVGDITIKGGLNYDIKHFSGTYSITFFYKKNKTEYLGNSGCGLTRGIMTEFLKAFNEAVKMVSEKDSKIGRIKKRLKNLYKLPGD
jgi:hypothetical protein